MCRNCKSNHRVKNNQPASENNRLTGNESLSKVEEKQTVARTELNSSRMVVAEKARNSGNKYLVGGISLVILFSLGGIIFTYFLTKKKTK